MCIHMWLRARPSCVGPFIWSTPPLTRSLYILGPICLSIVEAGHIYIYVYT